MDRLGALQVVRRCAACGLVLLSIVPLASCGAEEDARVPQAQAEASPAATGVAVTPLSATTPGTEVALPGASTEPKEREAENADPALLTAVRAARQDGFDRVVFEFKNAVPGYRIGYVERPVTEDGSGSEVSLDGAAVLQVRMQNASGVDLSQPEAPATYAGPARLTPDTSTVVELARTGDFEAMLTWAVGLRSRAPFAVTTLSGPPRLVIDVRNG